MDLHTILQPSKLNQAFIYQIQRPMETWKNILINSAWNFGYHTCDGSMNSLFNPTAQRSSFSRSTYKHPSNIHRQPILITSHYPIPTKHLTSYVTVEWRQDLEIQLKQDKIQHTHTFHISTWPFWWWNHGITSLLSNKLNIYLWVNIVITSLLRLVGNRY